MTEEPPRLAHNRTLCAEYMARSGVHSRFPKVSEQAELVPLDTSALPTFAYNPSILRHQGVTWLTYRYHGDSKSTRLGIAKVVKGLAVDHAPLPIAGVSVEDARLFQLHGEMWLSWVESDYIGQPNPSAIVKYAQLEHVFVADDKPKALRVGRIYQPGPTVNTGSHMQKNWCFFESDENLFAAYQSQPENIIFQIQGEAIINEYKTPAPRWAYGPIRGGNVVPYEDKLLRFFHSRTDVGLGKPDPRYYVGALLMDRRPPFAVTHVSRRPILFGSELPVYPCHHFKPNVVFPTGAIVDGDGFIVSVGVNDAASALVRITPEQFNL